MAVGVEAAVAVIAAALAKAVEGDSCTLSAVVVVAYEMAAGKTKKRRSHALRESGEDHLVHH